MGLVELALLTEEMGRALVPGPFLSTVICGLFIELGGSDAQKEQVSPADLRGDPPRRRRGHTSRTPAATLRLSQMHGGDRISGTKLFVTDAGAADFFAVVVKDGVYLVPTGPHAKIEPMHQLDLTRKTYAVTFDNAPAERLPYPGKLGRAVDVGTMAIAAESVGGMQRVLDIAVEYAKTRKQFGQPIGKYPGRAAHVRRQLPGDRERSFRGLLRGLGAAGGHTGSSHGGVDREDVRKRLLAERRQPRDPDPGGMGFTWENDVHLYYRRFKANETAFGDPHHHRERIAKLVIDSRAQEARA